MTTYFREETSGIVVSVTKVPEGYFVKKRGDHICFLLGGEIFDNLDDALALANEWYENLRTPGIKFG